MAHYISYFCIGIDGHDKKLLRFGWAFLSYNLCDGLSFQLSNKLTFFYSIERVGYNLHLGILLSTLWCIVDSCKAHPPTKPVTFTLMNST
jgi:hypothetical protein